MCKNPSPLQLLLQKPLQKSKDTSQIEKNKAAAAQILLRIQAQLDSSCTVTSKAKYVPD